MGWPFILIGLLFRLVGGVGDENQGRRGLAVRSRVSVSAQFGRFGSVSIRLNLAHHLAPDLLRVPVLSVLLCILVRGVVELF